MKTGITSNLRPLLRALHLFLIAIAVLWVMPRNAQAQLYSVTLPSLPGTIGTVSEYSTKGKLLNANFITGLNNPVGIAVLDNNLFVATYTSHVSTIGKYDAATGGTVNANFITGLHLYGAHGNALYGTIDPSYLSKYLSKYDASTGAVIDRAFIRVPESIAVAWLGHRLFLEKLRPHSDTATIGEYEAATGALINDKFITEVHSPTADIAVKSTK